MTGDPEGTHEHGCENGCGRFYVCPNDRCPGDWICPVCEQEDLDLYIEALAHNAERMTDADLCKRKQ